MSRIVTSPELLEFQTKKGGLPGVGFAGRDITILC